MKAPGEKVNSFLFLDLGVMEIWPDSWGPLILPFPTKCILAFLNHLEGRYGESPARWLRLKKKELVESQHSGA